MNLKKIDFKAFCMAVLVFLLATAANAQNSNFLQGEEHFRKNEPAKAIPLLETSITEGGNPRAYIYLALCYYQLERYQDALEVCNKGMLATGTNKKIIAYNAGNISFKMENYGTAEKWYSMALAADATYTPAILNRAQALLKQGRYLESRADYIRYQELAPDNRQYDEIQILIGLLDKEAERIAAEEEKARQEEIRIQAENARIEAVNAQIAAEAAAKAAAEEEARIAAEKAAEEARIQKAKAEEEARIAAEKAAEAERKAKEDAERRRKLLDDVASSLQDAETENMSAGAEGTVDYGYETELE